MVGPQENGYRLGRMNHATDGPLSGAAGGGVERYLTGIGTRALQRPEAGAMRRVMTDTNTANDSPRVVSLIASATEILHALDAGDLQVARSHECDWPPAVLDLPQLTRTKFKVKGATSAEIDRSVKALVEQGLAVYEVDAEGLQSMRPDVILTQDQCEVCAVSLRDVERALCTWTGTAAKVVSLKPHALGDVYADILTIATAVGRPASGEDLVGAMKQRLDSLVFRN